MFVPIVEQYKEAWEEAGRTDDIVIGSCCHAFAGSDHADMRESDLLLGTVIIGISLTN